jgi:hypothetical protein
MAIADKALLQSRPDPVMADKIADLRNMFRAMPTLAGWSLRKRLRSRAADRGEYRQAAGAVALASSQWTTRS